MPTNRDNLMARLSPADAEVVDALLEAAARGDKVEMERVLATQRGQKVWQVLSLFGQLPAEPAADDLAMRTLAAIAQAGTGSRAVAAAAGDLVAAGQTDFDLLDCLLERTAEGDRQTAAALVRTERGRRVGQWLDLIDHLPAEAPPSDLVARTMARVQQRSDREAVVAHIADHRPAVADAMPAIAFHWRELVAVAAMLMIAVSLLWPVMARMRTDDRRIACANNLATAGIGMRQYAADNSRVLPRYPTTVGSVWWNVGQPVRDGLVQSNSAHLHKLRREGYVTFDTLNCPTNPEAPKQLAISAFDWPNARAISYSYQNQYTPDPIRVDGGSSMVVLADKNPLFAPAADPGDADAGKLTFDAGHGLDQPGDRHTEPGQNILVIDGSVRWAAENTHKGDNFYTMKDVPSYKGTESPTQGDSFLVP